MGTNYYYVDRQNDIRTHIGNSSYGWQFLFAASVELDVYSSEQWMDLFLTTVDNDINDCVIENDYGEETTIDEFINIYTTESRQQRYDERRESDNEVSLPLECHYEYRIYESGLTNPGIIWKDRKDYTVELGDFS